MLPPDEQRRREQVFIDTLIRNIFRPGVERIPEPKMVVIKSDTGKWDLDEVVQLGVVGQVNLFGIQKMPGVLTVSPVIPKKEIAKLVGRSNFSYEVILSKNRPF